MLCISGNISKSEETRELQFVMVCLPTGTYLVEILAQYNWKRVVVISSTYILWEDMGVAIRKAFVDNNITVAYEVTYTGVPRNTFIHKTMEKIKLEARSKSII